MSELRALNPREGVLFIYCCGVKRALHNAKWATIRWICDIDIYVAQPVNHINGVPFVIVSAGRFGDLRDPHIKEHQWKQISFDELCDMAANK